MVAASDFRTRRIRNKLLFIALVVHSTWLLAASGGLFSVAAPFPSWREAATGFVVGVVVFYPLWRWNAMGAADVKLIATLGFILGVRGLLPTLLLASLAAGVHVVLLVWQGRWRQMRQQWQQGPGARRGLPYGGYLALAGVGWALWTGWQAYEYG